MCLEETLCTHARLLGYIVFPDQALYLCKKFFTWHEIRTVGQKKRTIAPVAFIVSIAACVCGG